MTDPRAAAVDRRVTRTWCLRRRHRFTCLVVGLALLGVTAGAQTPPTDEATPTTSTEATPAETALPVDVTVDGLRGAPRDNVLAALPLRRAQAEEARLSITAATRLHAQAAYAIERALEPFGFYQPTIEPSLAREGERWQARYVVDPGPRVHLDAVTLTIVGEGREEAPLRKVLAETTVKTGQPLDHGAYEQLKSRLLARALEAGFLDARFTDHAIEVDPADQRADVDLILDTGPRFRFGPVTFLQTVVDDEILVGHIPFERGDPYRAADLRLLQRSLQASDLWSLVVVSPRRDQAAAGEVPIEVNLTPRPRRRDAIGIGFSTDTGPRVSGSFAFRRLNRAGHRLQVDAEVSEVERSGGFRFVIPRAETERGIFRFDGGYEERTPDSHDNALAFVGASLAKLRGRSRIVVSLRAERHDFAVAGDRGVTELLVPGFSWSRVEADNRLRPRRGHRLEAHLSAGDSGLASDVSFLHLRLHGKLIRSLTPRWRLLARLDAGATFSSRFADLPPSLRFFAGGDESVRGFDYQELGPRDATGEVRGGDRSLVASAELELTIIGDWGAAVFFDYGTAFDDFDDWRPARGAGIGGRWFSPIGTVRADVAWALSVEGEPIRLHLGLGLEL